MFNPDFYPTSFETARDHLLRDINIHSDKILEPSAGKGDIVDAIMKLRMEFEGRNIESFSDYELQVYEERFDKKTPYIDVIEIEPELRAILETKKCNIVGYDFLQYPSGGKVYDYIIMNPPFSDGAKHLIHAWRISQGAEIRCLLNKETIDNPYSKERKLLKNIIADNKRATKGDYGYIVELGRPFANSERKSNVEVVMVVLKDTKHVPPFVFEFEKEEPEMFSRVDFSTKNELTSANKFDDLVARYNATKVAYAELLKQKQRTESYLKGILTEFNHRDLAARIKGENPVNEYNAIIADLEKMIWTATINNTGINEYAPSKTKAELQVFIEGQKKIPFSTANIKSLLNQLQLKQHEVYDEAIVALFDELSRYSPKNRHHVEGWKTNASHKLNYKIIIPNVFDWRMGGFKLTDDSYELLSDLDKIMSYLKQLNGNFNFGVDNVKTLTSFFGRYETSSLDSGTWYKTTFFEFKFFLKGTFHLKVREQHKDLWDKLNQIAAKKKGWLPDFSH